MALKLISNAMQCMSGTRRFVRDMRVSVIKNNHPLLPLNNLKVMLVESDDAEFPRQHVHGDTRPPGRRL